MQRILVQEGQVLPLTSASGRAGLIKRLMRISDGSQFSVFSLSHGLLRAGPVVGTVTCGNTRIEIRPKTVTGDAVHDRSFLLNLLRFCGYLNRYDAAPGSVQEITADPIEVLIGEVASDISAALLNGPPRRYYESSDESPTVRGRIDFTRLAGRLPSNSMRVPIKHAPLVINNDLSRMIQWVASTLLSLSRSVHTQEKLISALGALRSVDGRGFSALEASRLKLSRFETGWQRTLTMAKLLLEGNSLNPTLAGDADGIAVVFPLERLFEQCLRRFLSLALSNSGYSVNHRTDKLYMLAERGLGAGAIRIRPDFVYRNDGRAIAIGDAKWKQLVHDAPGYGVAPADVYQTASYLLRYQLKNALLFFPKAAWMEASWMGSFDISGTALRLHLVSVDIESLVSTYRRMREEALTELTKLVSFALGDL